MNHEHEGEWCAACLNEGYRRGRLAALRERAIDAIRIHRSQRKLNRLIAKSEEVQS